MQMERLGMGRRGRQLLVATLVLTIMAMPWAAAQDNAAPSTLVHRESRIFWPVGQDEPCLEADVMKYASSEYGVVEEQFNSQGTLMYRMILSRAEQRFVLMFPMCKQYLDFPAAAQVLEMLDDLTPQGLTSFFLSFPHEKQATSVIDGVEVQEVAVNVDEFLPQVTAAFSSMFPIRQLSLKLYLDPETSVAVRSEIQFTTGKGFLTGFQELQGLFTSYDLQWDRELDPAIFEVTIPDDYQKMNVSWQEIQVEEATP